MSSLQRNLLLLISDITAVNIASILLLWLRHIGGGLHSSNAAWKSLHPGAASGPPFAFVLSNYLYDALPAICALWLLLFLFYGMYRSRQSQSRFDEMIAVVKVVTLGTALFFVATFDPARPFPLSRALMFSYWLSLIGLVAGGRFAIRTIERQLLVRGIGRRRTVIVGGDDRGVHLLHELRSAPAQGFDVVGFVRARREEARDEVAGVPVLGNCGDLRRVIQSHSIENVLIALQSNSHEEVLEIIQAAEGFPVTFSIAPDLYDIVAGHVRTQQIYGVPLMELHPGVMPNWQHSIKRLIDVTIALVVLIGLSPLWLLAGLAIKLTSTGPVLFKQERVGKNGRIFTMYKFRSMYSDAEDKTGPVWVRGEDPRVTAVGRILRALHLDEIPQCLNFLKGDMSLVGPRPERPYFVERFRREIPVYMRRFNVKPGLLGWAQSKHEFDLNSSDLVGIVHERLQYDLYYIENMSLSLDFKIMLQTIWFVLAGKSTR